MQPCAATEITQVLTASAKIVSELGVELAGGRKDFFCGYQKGMRRFVYHGGERAGEKCTE